MQIMVRHPLVPRNTTMFRHPIIQRNTPHNPTTPTPNHSEVDVDVWPGDGPPATPPPPGCEVGDLYFDLVSGDVYQLDGD